MRSTSIYLVQSVFLITTLFTDPSVYAQTETEKITYGEEGIDSSDYSYKRKFQYLDINMKEENSLLSVGIVPTTLFSSSGDYNIGVVTKFDKKIKPSLSAYLEVIGIYSKASNILVSEGRYFQTALNLGCRYYYAQKKNVLMKTSSYNFNGPYLDFKMNSIININYYSLSKDSYLFLTKDSIFKQLPLPPLKGNEIKSGIFQSCILSWGYQQKITKYLFMDGNIFLSLNINNSSFYFDNNFNKDTSPYVLGVSFKFGLGNGWK